ncbi:hypothetical protein LX32DRAFT_639487 [Colletotrichum zoysiae]|uniref:Uncharacterized protein n=1 Tax=Colletotrichum zoysiae TaxID=1216348 RepID=A0AAD9HJ34_9PEZI|nr:hypothetical protein LX32DRAFT_639487 [Colletotrichum zoysiae]
MAYAVEYTVKAPCSVVNTIYPCVYVAAFTCAAAGEVLFLWSIVPTRSLTRLIMPSAPTSTPSELLRMIRMSP